MAALYSRVFAARGSLAAAAQVAGVMAACEERGLEVMQATGQVSSHAASTLQEELTWLAREMRKRHQASLAATHAEADGYERALVAPAVREAPKHQALLSQLSHEHHSSLAVSLARPSEWFELLSRSLALDEATIAQREEKLAAASAAHAAELEAHSARAAEEVASEEAIQLQREAALADESRAVAERMAAERRVLLADVGTVPDTAAAVRAAVEARVAEGEKALLERKRAATERLPPSMAAAAAVDTGTGSAGTAVASFDARRRFVAAGGGGGGEAKLEPVLPSRLREHFRELLDEARSGEQRPGSPNGSGAALPPVVTLSHAETDALHLLELELQASQLTQLPSSCALMILPSHERLPSCTLLPPRVRINTWCRVIAAAAAAAGEPQAGRAR